MPLQEFKYRLVRLRTGCLLSMIAKSTSPFSSYSCHCGKALSSGHHEPIDLVAISCRIVFRADNQTSAFLCALVDGLNNVNKLLLIFENPVQLIVITSPKIAHLSLVSLGQLLDMQTSYHVLVTEEKHQCHWVVKLKKCQYEGIHSFSEFRETYLIHLFEVWYLVKIADIKDGEVLDTIGNLCTH